MGLHVAENYDHTLGRCEATCSFHFIIKKVRMIDKCFIMLSVKKFPSFLLMQTGIEKYGSMPGFRG
jgi:hypothetical protein